MSPRRGSTRPWRRRSWISSRACAPSSTTPFCSSATVSRWSRGCATGWACSMRASWSRKGRRSRVFRDPRHPYTVGLMRCVPGYGLRKNRGRLETIPGFLPAPGVDHGPLRFRRALRQCDGALRARGSAAGHAGGASGALLLSGSGRATAAPVVGRAGGRAARVVEPLIAGGRRHGAPRAARAALAWGCRSCVRSIYPRPT